MFAIILIVVSPILALSIENWIFLWVLLEVSSVGFIIFMKSLEMSVVYFLTQTFGSVLILFHLAFWKENLFLSFSISPSLLVLGLILKMGVVPMHQWFLNVGSKIKKGALFVLMTVQKVIPLFLFKMFFKVGGISFLAMISVIFGVFFQFGVMNLKKLILYSSVANMGWLILLSSFHMTMLALFFILYSIILSFIIPFIEIKSIEIILGFMSLAGIPPLLGFYSKLIALKFFTVWSGLWGFMLLLTSVINTFIYFRIFMSLSLKTPPFILHLMQKSTKKMVLFGQFTLSLVLMII
uniref:NADH-ubiquinone oxidoreductase chain 2 n=1 Tax=Leptotrombidium akamushi TaxID=299468 RepID=Q3C2J3_9ACAR|nr:NADH dehydrogenase subunit 2 [Leptotrombidium akamushi]BAE47104.1 NADH dehydrogenase subunit 2 [Leptotrombidium akamushi]